jgi:peptide/nickel transport system substrate-binding protein
MYSNLLWNPGGTTLEPDAAESFEISADGLTWTFVLRPNVKFQSYPDADMAGPRDGTLMTAADVKYSMEKIMGLVDGIVSARSGWMKEFVDIDRDDFGLEVVDDRTIKFHLTQPFAGLGNILAIGFSGLYPEGTTRDMLGGDRPFGAGPYQLAEHQRGALWRWVPNPDYFKPGLPYVDEFHNIALDNPEIVEAAFLTKRIDLHTGNAIVSRDNRSAYQALFDSGEAIVQKYTPNCYPQGLLFNVTAPPFDNKELRQAVHLGIDREAYIQVVHDGNAEIAMFQKGAFARPAEEIANQPGYRQPHDQDLAEAQRIIADLYPSGLSITQVVRDSSGYMRENEFINGELRKMGINSTIDVMNVSQIFPLFTALNFEASAYWYCQTTLIPAELFGSYFITGGSRNWTGYNSAEIDRLFPIMVGALDFNERKRLAIEMEDIIMEDLPIAPTAVHQGSQHMRSYIEGFTIGITGYSDDKMELLWRNDI